MGPAEAPVVSKVAVFPLPEILPPLEVHPPTVTGTLSGLVQVQVMVAEAPVWSVDGLAEGEDAAEEELAGQVSAMEEAPDE